MTAPETPECPTCGHAARHIHTNIRRCDECEGPCVTEEGWRTFGIGTPWPGRRRCGCGHTESAHGVDGCAEWRRYPEVLTDRPCGCRGVWPGRRKEEEQI